MRAFEGTLGGWQHLTSQWTQRLRVKQLRLGLIFKLHLILWLYCRSNSQGLSWTG